MNRFSGGRGQGAMEYLMTYGWAILVVMIIGVALWKMGVFGHTGQTITRCNDFDLIKCFDPSVQYFTGSFGVLNATFMNGLNTKIEIWNVQASGDCDFTTANPDTSLIGGEPSPGNVVHVSAGETISFSCPSANVVDKVEAEPFLVIVTINFEEIVGTVKLNKTETGRLKGFAE
jgi:hypothetical protein